jgi:hypothetical protein
VLLANQVIFVIRVVFFRFLKGARRRVVVILFVRLLFSVNHLIDPLLDFKLDRVYPSLNFD